MTDSYYAILGPEMFPSYLEKPKNYHFLGQDPDEEILLVLRAHPITNLTWIVPALIIFFIPFFLPEILTAMGFGFPDLPPTILAALLVINYLLVLVITFEGFLFWYFNVDIITNKSIVDVDFNSILSRNIDETPLENVEQASSSQGGIIKSIFNFGNVSVQTAGPNENLDFQNVPKPHQVADFILDLVERT